MLHFHARQFTTSTQIITRSSEGRGGDIISRIQELQTVRVMKRNHYYSVSIVNLLLSSYIVYSKAPRVRISSQFSIFSAYIHTNNYISLCTIHRTDTKVWFWSSMCTHTISFIKVQFILQIYIFDISFLCDLIQE